MAAPVSFSRSLCDAPLQPLHSVSHADMHATLASLGHQQAIVFVAGFRHERMHPKRDLFQPRLSDCHSNDAPRSWRCSVPCESAGISSAIRRQTASLPANCTIPSSPNERNSRRQAFATNHRRIYNLTYLWKEIQYQFEKAEENCPRNLGIKNNRNLAYTVMKYHMSYACNVM